ncbi:hypothetical protein B0H11DRAFT_2430842 [Mycena galericulata]|nr:hypothetical protein B0H11DRAFT_2430842 [Mycena galericulata]
MTPKRISSPAHWYPAHSVFQPNATYSRPYTCIARRSCYSRRPLFIHDCDDLEACTRLSEIMYRAGYARPAIDKKLLFSRCTPGLRTLDLRYVSVLPGPGIAPGEPHSRVQLTHIELLNPGREVAEGTLDPRCPLVFNQPRRVNVVKAVTLPLIEILEAARLNITVLNLQTHDAAAGLDLARFPAFADLRIVGSPADMEPAFARFAFIPENSLTNLLHIALASRTFTFDDPTPPRAQFRPPREPLPPRARASKAHHAETRHSR